MAIINLPLVPTLPVDGQVGDATPLAATINYIVAQVNANAQPLTGAAISEWQPTNLTPTFLSATSFSLPGNVTALFPPKQKIQTLNTGGTVYSVVLNSAFGVSTTVNVFNYVGVLDSGLSVVKYSLLNAMNTSTPGLTNLQVSMGVFAFNNLVSGTTYTYGKVATPWPPSQISNDIYSEWSTSSGQFVAQSAGIYLATFNAFLVRNGASISSVCEVEPRINGIYQNELSEFLADGSGNNYTTTQLSTVAKLNTGDTLDFTNANNLIFTGGPAQTVNYYINIIQLR